MTQAIDPVEPLRDVLRRAERLNLCVHNVVRRGALPVGTATIYRWLRPGARPGAHRLAVVTAAALEFVSFEENRLKRGAKTFGGPLTLDEEFSRAERGGATVALKGQEFKLLETLKSTPRPAYFDWICDVSGISPKSLPRAKSELSRKLDALDLEVRTITGKGGEPSAYYLDDLFMGRENAA